MGKKFLREPFQITGVVPECTDIKTFMFDRPMKAGAGQFVMVQEPGGEEKPFSVSYTDPLGITFRRVGPFTERLYNMDKGNVLNVQGPFGRGFSFEYLEDVHIVAGGCGAPPLALLAEQLKGTGNPVVHKVNVLLGAKSEEHLLFEERFRSVVGSVTVVTEDGSKGEQGLVTKYMNRLPIRNPNYVATCGPEKMMKHVAQYAVEITRPERIYLSLERYMGCGRGLCDKCDFGGLCVCQDGPVFGYDIIKDIHDLGKFKLDKSGKRVPI